MKKFINSAFYLSYLAFVNSRFFLVGEDIVDTVDIVDIVDIVTLRIQIYRPRQKRRPVSIQAACCLNDQAFL